MENNYTALVEKLRTHEDGYGLYDEAADAIDVLLDMVDQMQEEAENRYALIQFYEDCFEDILYAAKKAMRGSE